jgi:hypothetical protein
MMRGRPDSAARRTSPEPECPPRPDTHRFFRPGRFRTKGRGSDGGGANVPGLFWSRERFSLLAGTSGSEVAGFAGRARHEGHGFDEDAVGHGLAQVGGEVAREAFQRVRAASAPGGRRGVAPVPARPAPPAPPPTAPGRHGPRPPRRRQALPPERPRVLHPESGERFRSPSPLRPGARPGAAEVVAQRPQARPPLRRDARRRSAAPRFQTSLPDGFCMPLDSGSVSRTPNRRTARRSRAAARACAASPRRSASRAPVTCPSKIRPSGRLARPTKRSATENGATPARPAWCPSPGRHRRRARASGAALRPPKAATSSSRKGPSTSKAAGLAASRGRRRSSGGVSPSSGGAG